MIKFDRKQDKVCIIAPSSACKDEQGNLDVEASLHRLKSIQEIFLSGDFQCQYTSGIIEKNDLEYMANYKDKRLDGLKLAILDPQVKIISAFRGGYGALELIFDCLKIKPSAPKILIGFSDITALHFLFNQHYNLPSIHGAVAPNHEHLFDKMVNILSGNEASFSLEAINKCAKENQQIEGVTTGGNLTIICNMIGTKLHPDTNNKILIIEDVAEQGYRIHRYLLHMYNAGLFDNVRAVILGDFTQGDNHIDASIEHFARHYLQLVPVFKAKSIGHGKDNYPFALGSNAKIENDILRIDSPFGLI